MRLRYLKVGQTATAADVTALFPPKQEIQKDELNRFAGQFNCPTQDTINEFNDFRREWLYRHWAKGSRILELQTVQSLAAQVSSSSVYENAGLPLDFMRGVIQLDSSQIKGLAATYAATVWFPRQYTRQQGTIAPKDDAHAEVALNAWLQIEQVFGWGPESHLKAIEYLHPDLLKKVEAARKRAPQSRGLIDFSPAISATLSAGDTDDGSPRLKVEIINNHHRDYYEGKGWPGDWEDQVPTYFLAIRPGARFQFPLSKRRFGVDDKDLELAEEWLVGGLSALGFGAKTAVGYGRFDSSYKRMQVLENDGALELCDPPSPQTLQPSSDGSVDILTADELNKLLPGVVILQRGMNLVLEAELQLLTPAFVGGANQTAKAWEEYARACQPADLNSTLHQLAENDRQNLGKAFKAGLRWWWRTMHSGFLTREQLSQTEAQLFGSTELGNRVIVSFTRTDPDQKLKVFNFRDHDLVNKSDTAKKSWARVKEDNALGIERIPEPAPGANEAEKEKIKFSTQGLFYAGYGMDDKGRRINLNSDKLQRDQFENPTLYQRHYQDSGCTTSVCIEIRCDSITTSLNSPRYDAILQIVHALRLFTVFGGIGARSRKGFGTFEVGQISSTCNSNLQSIIDAAKANAVRFRTATQPNQNTFCDAYWASPSLEKIVGPVSYQLGDVEVNHPAMVGIDRVGMAMQQFAQQYQHRLFKAGLGLPRIDIHASYQDDDGAISTVKKHLGNDYRVDHERGTEYSAEVGRPSHKPLSGKLSRFASPIYLRVLATPGVIPEQNNQLRCTFLAFIDPVIPHCTAEDGSPMTSQVLLTMVQHFLETKFRVSPTPDNDRQE